jgi:hypothetical protein
MAKYPQSSKWKFELIGPNQILEFIQKKMKNLLVRTKFTGLEQDSGPVLIVRTVHSNKFSYR